MEVVSVVKRNFIKYIDKLIKNKKVSHAYLIEIDEYERDSKYIYDFIKMILCDCSYQELDGSKNKIISLVDSNNYPDLKLIEPDGAWIKKNQLLDLQKDYSNKSLFGKKRIYVIKDAEKLNTSSANTMLKFLEEPENDIIALLVTNNRYHVIDTILSRCQILSLKEDKYSLVKNDILLDFIDCILNPKNFFIKYNFLIRDEIADKNVFKEILSSIEDIFIIFLNTKYLSGDMNFLDDDFYELIKKYDDSILIKYISIIEEEIPKLEFNVNYKLWLYALFAKLIEVSLND